MQKHFQNQVRKPVTISPAQLASLAQTVQQSLLADCLDLDKLDTLLTEERSALETNDAKQVQALAQDKEALAKQMEARQAQRQLKLQQHQLAHTPEHWAETLDTLQKNSQVNIAAQWQQTKDKLVNCQTKMLVNEKIIASMQQKTHRFMNILRGQLGNTQTYDAKGNKQNHTDLKPITSA